MKFSKIRKSLDELSHVDGERISLNQILNSGKDNLYFTLFLISLLSLIPTPAPFPIISNFFGLMGSVILCQLVCGKKNIFMPKFIGNIAMKKQTLCKIIAKIDPIVIKIEKITRERLNYFNNETVLFAVNIFLVLMSLNLMVPLPIISVFPSVAMIVIIFGLLNDDGLLVTIGFTIGFLSIFLTVKTLHICMKLILKLIHVT